VLPSRQTDNLVIFGPRQEIPVSAAFPVAGVDEILTALHLPFNTPLSVLAVELFNKESAVIPQPPGAAITQAQSVALPDPLGANLGSQRILRVSPLTPVRAIC
jgi:hypothetical protein